VQENPALTTFETAFARGADYFTWTIGPQGHKDLVGTRCTEAELKNLARVQGTSLLGTFVSVADEFVLTFIAWLASLNPTVRQHNCLSV
jgi:hypothetical protein